VTSETIRFRANIRGKKSSRRWRVLLHSFTTSPPPPSSLPPRQRFCIRCVTDDDDDGSTKVWQQCVRVKRVGGEKKATVSTRWKIGKLRYRYLHNNNRLYFFFSPFLQPLDQQRCVQVNLQRQRSFFFFIIRLSSSF